MIIAQEQAFLKAQSQLKEICQHVTQMAVKGEWIDVVQRELFSRLLAVGQTVLQAFVAFAKLTMRRKGMFEVFKYQAT